MGTLALMRRRLSPDPDLHEPPPIRVRDTHGVERLVGRRKALHLAGRLFCPREHLISDSLTGFEEDTFRCEKNLEGTSTPCGTLLYVVAGFKARCGAELTHAAEVTYDEIRRMRHMPIEDKLHYLTLTWAKGR